ncbi:hypothetical protein BDQ12DRAFT_669421 [Crucibulum laeve]|uniref:G domain-containing protein n=1 Tax=Crucibulum laeve TaxID=68775 RepID=A0A5C3LNX6_9AGAR|nr:hypothetical protein BDQ12DRAFT_669421 [Crucibulum laeve]
MEPCERIVVLNKCDLVPEWNGNKYYRAQQRPRGVQTLNELPFHVLVIGMPNVDKSMVFNALRNMGIKGGIILPFLGRGAESAERGFKFTLNRCSVSTLSPTPELKVATILFHP